MEKYVVKVSSLTYKGKALKKGKELNLDDAAAKPLLDAKSIELVSKKTKEPVKKEK